MSRDSDRPPSLNRNPLELLGVLEYCRTEVERDEYLRSVFIETEDVGVFLTELRENDGYCLTKEEWQRLVAILKAYSDSRKWELRRQLIEYQGQGSSEKKAADPEKLDVMLDVRFLTIKTLDEADAPSDGLLALEPGLEKAYFAHLRVRFLANMNRHEGVEWFQVQDRLEKSPEKVWSLWQMELTGGEPDVAGVDEETGGFLFFDFCKESPSGRQCLFYDRESQDVYEKEHPEDKRLVDQNPDFKIFRNAFDFARRMRVQMMGKDQLALLAKFGVFDRHSQSWVFLTEPERNEVEEKYGRRMGLLHYSDDEGSHVIPCSSRVRSLAMGCRSFRGWLKV